MKTKIVVKKKGREKERREIFGLVKWCIKFCLYTYCDSCIRALLLRMYRALATLPTTSIKAHAHVAATYSAPAPLRGPGSKRTESFLGGACTPATEKKIVTIFFPPFSSKTNIRYIVSVMKKGYTSIFLFFQLIRKEREELKLLEEEEFSFFLQVKID